MPDPILVQESQARFASRQAARGGAPIDPALALKDEQIRLREEGRRKSEGLARAKEFELKQESLDIDRDRLEQQRRLRTQELEQSKVAQEAATREARATRKAAEPTFIEGLFST